jgi:hypothetical protein
MSLAKRGPDSAEPSAGQGDVAVPEQPVMNQQQEQESPGGISSIVSRLASTAATTRLTWPEFST